MEGSKEVTCDTLQDIRPMTHVLDVDVLGNTSSYGNMGRSVHRTIHTSHLSIIYTTYHLFWSLSHRMLEALLFVVVYVYLSYLILVMAARVPAMEVEPFRIIRTTLICVRSYNVKCKLCSHETNLWWQHYLVSYDVEFVVSCARYVIVWKYTRYVRPTSATCLGRSAVWETMVNPKANTRHGEREANIMYDQVSHISSLLMLSSANGRCVLHGLFNKGE